MHKNLILYMCTGLRMLMTLQGHVNCVMKSVMILVLVQ